MSEEPLPTRYLELRTVCPLGDCPVTVYGEPHGSDMQIKGCSRWGEGHHCRAECAGQVSLEYAIELGRRVQETLEPAAFHRVEDLSISSWMSVSQRVGGDFQAVHCLDQRILAIQGDVMGKGVNAALLAAYLLGLFEGLAQQGLPLRQLLTGMNHSMCERTRSRTVFATALALEVDLATRHWSFSRAGHELPLLTRGTGRLCRLVKDSGLPLGVDPHEHYPVYRRPLQSGDRLLLYTDGALEAGATRGQFLEKMTLPEVRMEDLVETIPGVRPYRDDVSLLLFCCETLCRQAGEVSGVS